MEQLPDSDASRNGVDVLAVEVATFPYMKAVNPRNRRLSDVLNRIQNGGWAKRIKGLRKLIAEGNEETYHKRKEGMPSFYASGSAASTTEMTSHSGLIQSDLDKLGDRFGELREAVMRDAHSAAVFTSPSGRGLKVLFRVAPVGDGGEHEEAFAAMTAYFERTYDISPDPSCKNWNRHCLVSYDPELHRNSGAIPFDWRAGLQGVDGEREREGSSAKTLILQGCTTVGLLDYDTTSQSPVIVEKASQDCVLAAMEFQRQIEERHPVLWRQYETLVDRRHEARGARRNETIIQAVPFLYRALDAFVVRLYLEWFYRCNAHVFKDPIEKHMYQVEAMLESAATTFESNLSKTEHEFWLRLNARNKAAFRISRDLALFSGPAAPAPPDFHLSADQLATRLGLVAGDGRAQCEAGARCLRTLLQFNIIVVATPGLARVRDVAGISTTYRWLLPPK